MEYKNEYHDPDYPEASGPAKERSTILSDEERIEKIKNIIRNEFGNELDVREKEVMLADQRMLKARQALHNLRYTIVKSFYNEQKLQLTPSQLQDELAAQNEPRARTEVTALLRDSQQQIHPSLKKLLGKKTVDLQEIFKTREPRNTSRKDYYAMLKTRNYTISADSTKSLRPETQKPMDAESTSLDGSESSDKPRKVPRSIAPKVTNVVTLDEITRNKIKHRYRIIIGNTSKYAPAASRADRSTHTWLLYVRGAAEILHAVTVRLHHSYAPHHVVRLEKPPFHVSRRGWGEFTARVELHFALPERNRPASVEHNIRLDRHCTGLQTLGAETVVDVWLYSTPEMLEFEYKDDVPANLTQENEEREQASNEAQKKNHCDDVSYKVKLKESNSEQQEEHNKEKFNDDWLEFFSKDSTELNVDEMLVKNVNNEVMDFENEAGDDFTLNNTHDSGGDNCVLYNPNRESNATDLQLIKPFETITAINRDELPAGISNQSKCLKKKVMKYIDPATKKIYYLEVDKDLDISKVQEIVVNTHDNEGTRKITPFKSNGVKKVTKTKSSTSLLRPEIRKQLKKELNKKKINMNQFRHIENDHCYVRNLSINHLYTEDNENLITNDQSEEDSHHSSDEKNIYETLCLAVLRFPCVRMAVNYLLKKIPLISIKACDSNYVKYFPWVVESEDKYWRLDFAKRRNIEWSRAKLINKIMIEHLKTEEPVWRTKQILIYSRLHGFYPVREESVLEQNCDNNDWFSWNLNDGSQKTGEKKTKDCSSKSLSSLTMFCINEFLSDCVLSDSLVASDSDEEIDIVNCENKVKVNSEVTNQTSLEVLPVETEEERLKFLFIERKCADIGIELRNEDIGNGYSYSAVHAVLLSAFRSFAEEVLRSGLAAVLTRDAPGVPQVWSTRARRTCVGARDVYAGVLATQRLQVLSARGLGAPARTAHPL